MTPKTAIETVSRKRSMHFPPRSASSFRRHCECPSFLRPLQVFTIQIVAHVRLPKLNLPTIQNIFQQIYNEWFPFFWYIQFDTFIGYSFQHLVLKYAKISISTGITYRRCKHCNQFIRIIGHWLRHRMVNSQGPMWQQARDCSNSRQGYNGFARQRKIQSISEESLTRRETFACPSDIEASHDALGWSSRPHSKLDSLTLREWDFLYGQRAAVA